MILRQGQLRGSAGRALFFQAWEPEGEALALILLVHGAGEHSERYQSLAAFFTAQGYVVAALDHNGHGQSEGIPGFVSHFDNYVDDLGTFHHQLSRDYGALPMFLLGHSLGGLIGAHYLLRQQAAFIGAIFSGPLVMVEPDPGWLQRSLIRLLGTVAPRLGVLSLDAGGVSRDPAVVAAYVADPLVFHGRMSARQLREMFAAMKALQERAAEITLPLLLLHGGEDSMAAPEGTRWLHSHIGSSDKTLHIYPGLYHEIFNEPERLEVLGEVLAWCGARLVKP